MAESIGFVTACSKYFGRKEGQNLSEFRDEIKTLTAEDRAEMASLLAVVLGVPVTLEPAAK